MSPELERLYRLCLEGDVEAERRLFELLRRRVSPPVKEKTPHLDGVDHPIFIGDCIIYVGIFPEIGFIKSFSKQMIRVVWKNRESSINPRNCVAVSPLAIENRPWSSNYITLQDTARILKPKPKRSK